MYWLGAGFLTKFLSRYLHVVIFTNNYYFCILRDSYFISFIFLSSNESAPKTPFYYKLLQNLISSSSGKIFPQRLVFWDEMVTPAGHPPALRFSHLKIPRIFTLMGSFVHPLPRSSIFRSFS